MDCFVEFLHISEEINFLESIQILKILNKILNKFF